MAVRILGDADMPLISPGSSSYSVYDPTLPNRILTGAEQAPTQSPVASTAPGQGPQYNPSFGADTNPTPTPSGPATALTYPPSFAVTGGYNPSPLGSALASAARPAVAPRAAAGPNVEGVFSNLPDNTFNGANRVQTAQAPQGATPQGWNLFAAIGQALGHLLGYNASGQPQGMSGLLRQNPVPTAAPAQTAPMQTAALRMPVGASRYQGRTLVG